MPISLSAAINSSGNEVSILQNHYKSVDFISATLLIEEFSKKIIIKIALLTPIL
jgi:hypothetical protein